MIWRRIFTTDKIIKNPFCGLINFIYICTYFKLVKMKTITLVFGAIYGMASVILGAFGAHLFKKLLPIERLTSFEIGVKYQMYAAFFLLIVGYILKFETTLEKSIAWLMILGTIFFSVSIYFLSFQEYWGVNLRFLGPITPFGGMLMIISWFLLIVHFIKNKF